MQKIIETNDKYVEESGMKFGLTHSEYIINNNNEINGYSLNILNNKEIKCRAYADDVNLFTKDSHSIYNIFYEFELWGQYSGAEINKDKTKIINIR